MSLLDLLSNHFQNHLIKYVLTYPGNYKPIKSESQSLKLLIGRGKSEISKFLCKYSSVHNRREGQNKRAGGKILRKH